MAKTGLTSLWSSHPGLASRLQQIGFENRPNEVFIRRQISFSSSHIPLGEEEKVLMDDVDESAQDDLLEVRVR